MGFEVLGTGVRRRLAPVHIYTYTFHMAQITLYLPDAVAARIRNEAKRSGKSLSAYMAELATGGVPASGWPVGFARLYGSCELPPAIEDAPPAERDAL